MSRPPRTPPIVLVLLVLSAGGCRSSADTSQPVVSLPGGLVRIGNSAEALRRFRLMFPALSDRVFEAELPQRTVTIAPFTIDRHEVTNEAFSRFVAANPAWRRHGGTSAVLPDTYLQHWPDGAYPAALARHPVVNVPWQAVDAYCRWRNGRLPTEAEWEYAARGGLPDRHFPWGDDPPDPSRANYVASGFETTVRAGSYPPNGYGIYDMSGNVWEWTNSCNDKGECQRRGGSLFSNGPNARCAIDSVRPRDFREDSQGFRCCSG
jgi:formylglycine-generating enzyme required for sulfatase activity